MVLPALPRPHVHPDVLIVGAGIVGLALALEMHARGAQVVVLERDTALSHSSTAAAGMLAARDPHNPPALAPLSELSLSVYPAFLERIERHSGIAVHYQTDVTVQYTADGSSVRLAEHSLDPRQLAPALLAAVRATNIDLREHTPLESIAATSENIIAVTPQAHIAAKQVVYATGAWFQGKAPVSPRKGQMLRVRVPAELELREVHRSEHVYVVPRMHGPQAGTALIGATVEDAGYDTSTHPQDLANLRRLASDLLPALASETEAPTVEAWAGLRPTTPDSLPILGAGQSTYAPSQAPREFFATGHFRNGILLAPATAVVLADLLEGKQPTLDLTAFSPARFGI